MDIQAFRGWRYRLAGSDVSSVVAPPYDILSAADKDAMLARDGRNIVAVDLPHCPPKDVGPDEVYRAAAERLGEWMASGLLARDERPCLYAYEQGFTWAGRSYRRRSLLAAVRLTEFGQGVWPHEKTFAGPKADRLKLTQATRVQLSPIFGFCPDPSQAVRTLFDAAGAAKPDATATLAGVDEKLWAVADPALIEPVRQALAAEPLFIADGHHRYTTALNYRNSLGTLSGHHPANFVMFAITPMDDPGLVILPTHRLISGLDEFTLDGFINSTRRVITFEPANLKNSSVTDADRLLSGYGPHAMALAASDGAGGVTSVIATVIDPAGLMRKVASDQSDAWRNLDVSILHRLILEHFMRDSVRAGHIAIEYTPDGSAALTAAREGKAQLAVLLQSTPIEAVRRIALSGAVMPHKSTYFYPKLATGLVLYGM